MTPEQWAQLVQSTGLGGLVALLLYKIIMRFGAFCGPKVESIVNEHRSFLDVTKSAVKVIEGTLTIQHRADIDAHNKTHGKLDEIHGIVRKLPQKPGSDFTGEANTNRPRP